MNTLRTLFLISCFLIMVLCSIGIFLGFPGFALSSDGATAEEIVWNGGMVEVLDFSGIPFVHHFQVVYCRPGERAELLCSPGQYEPKLSVTADGDLRMIVQIKSPLPNAADAGEEVEWNNGVVKVVKRTTNDGPTYFVHFFRDEKLTASLLDLGHSKPQVSVDEHGLLTAVSEFHSTRSEEKAKAQGREEAKSRARSAAAFKTFLRERRLHECHLPFASQRL